MVNYDSDLKYLFEHEANDTSNSKPYYIDNILFSIIKEDTWQNNVSNIDKYLKLVPANIYQQESLKVRQYTDMGLPGEVFNSDGLYPEPSNEGDYINDGNKYDFNITVRQNDEMAVTVFKNMINEIVTNRLTDTNITKDHKKFRDFLFAIMENFTKCQLYVSKTILGAALDIVINGDNNKYNFLENVSVEVGKLSLSKTSILIDILHKSCTKAFKELLEKSVILNSNDIIDLSIGGSSSFSSKLYYKLRSSMISNVDVTPIYQTDDTNLLLLYKKYVVDMFIKTCYPLVQLIYMESMLLVKMKKGDYVNVRVIVLAMAYYVYYTLKKLIVINSNMNNNDKISVTQENAIGTMMQNIVTYIENNTKADINATSANDAMKKIVVDLHDLSGQVVRSNKTIQDVKNQISDNQLAMRNVLFNISIKRKSYERASLEFYISLVILLVFIITNTLLLSFELGDIVYIVCGVMSLIIVMYLTTMMFILFMKSNK